MGFWSKLAKGLAVAAPFVAAPFTGGASLLGLVGAGTGEGIGLAASHGKWSGLAKGGAIGAGAGFGLGAATGAFGSAAAGGATSLSGGTSLAGTIPDIATTSGFGGLPAAFGGAAGASGGAGGIAGIASKALGAKSLLGAAGGSDGQAGGQAPQTGILGILAKLKAAGIDPTTLGLGAAGIAAAGNGQTHPYNPYEHASPEASELVSPVQSMYNYMNSLNNFGVSQNNAMRNGFTAGSSFVPAPAKPVNIPGLNFQIGGGLGTDPALKDPSLLHTQTDGDFFSSMLGSKGVNMAPGNAPVPRKVNQ